MCGKIDKNIVCEKCKKQIVQLKKVEKNTNFEDLKEKLQSEIYFDEQIFFFEYKGIIRDKIINYKFNEKSYLYKTFAELIISIEFEKFIKEYDMIIPVPISKKRMKERGYNQSLLILKYLLQKNKLNNIYLEDKILYKVKNIKPQSSMKTKQDRINNIKGVYEVKNNLKIKNKRIIIFDDIFTTGSTVNECAKILKKAGAEKIGVITIAKDFI